MRAKNQVFQLTSKQLKDRDFKPTSKRPKISQKNYSWQETSGYYSQYEVFKAEIAFIQLATLERFREIMEQIVKYVYGLAEV